MVAKPIAYLDTSLYVRRFVREGGTESTLRLLSRFSLVSSFLLQIETASAISRKRAEGVLSDEELERVRDEVFAGLRHISFVVVDASVAKQAREAVSKHGLRSLDAVHLGTALFLRESVGADIPFLTADARLADAAHRERFRVLGAG